MLKYVKIFLLKKIIVILIIMDKIDISTQTEQPVQIEQPGQTEQPVQTEQPGTTAEKQVSLLDIAIDNENIALNVLVGMVNIAQKRGVFTLSESAKTWECVQMFMKTSK